MSEALSIHGGASPGDIGEPSKEEQTSSQTLIKHI